MIYMDDSYFMLVGVLVVLLIAFALYGFSLLAVLLFGKVKWRNAGPT